VANLWKVNVFLVGRWRLVTFKRPLRDPITSFSTVCGLKPWHMPSDSQHRRFVPFHSRTPRRDQVPEHFGGHLSSKSPMSSSMALLIISSSADVAVAVVDEFLMTVWCTCDEKTSSQQLTKTKTSRIGPAFNFRAVKEKKKDIKMVARHFFFVLLFPSSKNE